jgi:hypothetical protein
MFIIMKTRKEQATTNPDVHYRQKRLWDGRIQAQVQDDGQQEDRHTCYAMNKG